jgi:hypothetical protein
MPTRLVIAYVLIALMVAAGTAAVWHLTKGSRHTGRGRRAHERARKAKTKPN